MYTLFTLYITWLVLTVIFCIILVAACGIISHFFRKGVDKLRKVCYNKATKAKER